MFKLPAQGRRQAPSYPPAQRGYHLGACTRVNVHSQHPFHSLWWGAGVIRLTALIRE